MGSTVYALEDFFINVLRWLERLACKVLPLRPLIGNALYGRFPDLSSSVLTSEVYPTSEMMTPHSFVWHICKRFPLTHRAIRKTVSRLIASVLLQEPFHRRVFAYTYISFYDEIMQGYVYDDHLHADSLISMSCQFLTAASLSRYLLIECDALMRMFKRVVMSILTSSNLLPSIYESTDSNKTITAQFCNSSLPSPLTQSSSVLNLMQSLKSGNSRAWTAMRTLLNNKTPCEDMMCLTWHNPPHDGNPNFHPFERLLGSVSHDVGYVLTSLLNIRPIPGWWNEKARQNFMNYFKELLRYFCFAQDMNGLYRATISHVEIESEWLSTFQVLANIHRCLERTIQVASTDKKLLLQCIEAAKDMYERRIGIIDRCFHVKEYTGYMNFDEMVHNELSVQCIGATSVVYDYDIMSMRFSPMQPLPRLLAALYGHALEMGISPTRLGLTDKDYVNLLIERPLQNVAFVAQAAANFWVRNGQTVRNIIYNIHRRYRTDLIDRDYQLLQQAAAVLLPDEFLVRLCHKLNLVSLMNWDILGTSISVRVHFIEAFLRLLLYVLTHRTTDGVAYYDPGVFNALPQNSNLFPDAKLGGVDEALEVHYGQLVDDVIHTLCIKPMTHSKLTASLASQFPGCLLRKAPPYPPPSHSVPGSSSVTSGHVLPITSSWKERVERPLIKILDEVAITSRTGNQKLFSIKPEVAATRFNRFYFRYQPSERTAAQENIINVLKAWTQKSSDSDGKRFQQLPIPPPLPRPHRRFHSSMSGILQIMRCKTFVRIIRQLLSLALASKQQTKQPWTELLTELTLHLITIALYEDVVAFKETGRRPFMEAVASVPLNESFEDLKNLAVSKFWRQTPPSGEQINTEIFVNETTNCVLGKLVALHAAENDPEVAKLIKWTIDLWNEVAAKPKTETAPMEVDTQTPMSNDEQKRAKMKRYVDIMGKMAQMQRRFIETHFQDIAMANEAEQPMDTSDPTIQPTSNLLALKNAVSDSVQITFSPLLPNCVESRISQLLNGERSTITCNMCLEEFPMSEFSNFIGNASANRSNVLFITPPHGQVMDFIQGKECSDCTERTLGGIATSAVSGSVGAHESSLSRLPYLLSGLNQTTPSNPGSSTQSPLPGPAHPDVIDPWFPRPLIVSRWPVGEEGTFISCCQHFVHARCKENYMKRRRPNRMDEIRIRRRSQVEYSCTLCHFSGNFDYPIVDPFPNSVPVEWFTQCLRNRIDLVSWLKNLQTWFNVSPKISATMNFKIGSFDGNNSTPELLTKLFAMLNDIEKQEESRNIIREIRSVAKEILVLPDNGQDSTSSPSEVEEGSIADSTNVSVGEKSERPGVKIRFRQLLHFPRPDDPHMHRNLWSFVKAIVHLSQPRPIDVNILSSNPSPDVPLNFPDIENDEFEQNLPDWLEIDDNEDNDEDMGMDFPNALFEMLQQQGFKTGSRVTAPRQVHGAVHVPSEEPSADLQSSSRLPYRLRASLLCTRGRALQALSAASSTMRTLRHTIAYTILSWERYLRRLGPHSHFFSGHFTERHSRPLMQIVHAAFLAHARLAPVSRSVFGLPVGGDSENAVDAGAWDGNAKMRQWILHRDDAEWWWWYCYFTTEGDAGSRVNSHCSHAYMKEFPNATENILRIAVTQDAIRLWRLLLPDSSSLCEEEPVAGPSSLDPYAVDPSVDDVTSALPSPDSLGIPSSLIWDADITHLLINLLFLRPGLEPVGHRVICQRIAQHERVSELESKELLPDVTCNDGFPRLPIGDSHDAFTVRICFLALLVQTLLSWKRDAVSDETSNDRKVVALNEPCALLWMTDKLLAVRRRLQHLAGLPVCTIEATAENLAHLFSYIHKHCLPFLRIAAYLISLFTKVDVPSELSNPRPEEKSCEFSLLLAYLGLPQAPSDLLVLLSDAATDSSTASPQLSFNLASPEVSTSSSLWLASLMTSWCLLGRQSVARRLYSKNLIPRYFTLPAASGDKHLSLLPEPYIKFPRLIRLPKDYATLISLVTEIKGVHRGSNIHSDPSLCLVCGAVACYACYSCRREKVVFDIQAHIRRFHAGYGLAMLFSGGVLLFSDQARRVADLGSPYTDEFGETDIGLRRGNPLYLDEKLYEEFNLTWLKHETKVNSSSNVHL
nr:e3 ubiquitin protein ligase ubr2 [Hymenolepis microstoma]